MKELIKLIQEDNGDLTLHIETKNGPYNFSRVLADSFNKEEYEPVTFIIDVISWFLAHEPSGKLEKDVINKIKELVPLYRKYLFDNNTN